MTDHLDLEPEQLKSLFFNLETPEDVAAMLQVSYQDLIYYLYRLKPDDQYTLIEVPKKSGGKRALRIPISPLKIVQHKLNQVLNSIYEPRNSVHGFVAGKSVLTNAAAHLDYGKRNFVLNVDIKDFFPSINFGRVRGLFIAAPYNRPPEVATVLAQICCAYNQLPQGAPTSPTVANMICAKLDSQLQKLAAEHKCYYTRYADDITFSTSISRFPRELARISDDGTGKQIVAGNKLSEIIEANGFELNPEKVRLQRRDRRQEITGLTVNKFPNVSPKYINQIRAMLHAWEKYGYENAEREHFARWKKGHHSPYSSPTSYSNIVRGKIEYLGMIRGVQSPIYRRFMSKLLQLDPKQKKSGLFGMRDQVFISYSHRDARWLERLQVHLKPLEGKHHVSIWDDTKIKAGMEWRKEIEQALNTAKVAVLLVSGDFLASDFITQHELPHLLKAAKDEGVAILWVLISPCNFQATEIVGYQATHNIARSLDSLSRSRANAVLVEISKKIVAEASK